MNEKKKKLPESNIFFHQEIFCSLIDAWSKEIIGWDSWGAFEEIQGRQKGTLFC